MQWRDHILFRNYLNNNKELIQEYSNIKKILEKEINIDREEYTIKKTLFIQEIIKKAELHLNLQNNLKP